MTLGTFLSIGACDLWNHFVQKHVARSRDNEKEPMSDSENLKAGPFDYGAGHVRPNRAMDPGLVYDLSPRDYLNFLCKLGYNSTQLVLFLGTSGGSFNCGTSKLHDMLDMNYPAITVPSLSRSTTITRRLKNVGSAGTYKAKVVAPPGVSISVEPAVLRFGKVGEEKSFKVTLAPTEVGRTLGHRSGRIVWSDGVRHVRSPVVVS